MEQFAFIITCQMEFEAIEPAHCAFASGCQIFKNTISFAPFVFANGHCRGIHKVDTRTFAKTNQFQKQGKGDHNLSFSFNATVVRKQMGKYRANPFPLQNRLLRSGYDYGLCPFGQHPLHPHEKPPRTSVPGLKVKTVRRIDDHLDRYHPGCQAKKYPSFGTVRMNHIEPPSPQTGTNPVQRPKSHAAHKQPRHKDLSIFMSLNLFILNILLFSPTPYKCICRQRATETGQKLINQHILGKRF
jgi:hypothetical protein